MTPALIPPPSTDDWFQVAYIVAAGLLVLLNAFFVLAEFAIVKVRATKMLELAEKGNSNAELVTSIIRQLDAYLSACQLGITIASLGLGWVGEPAFAKLLEPRLEGLGWWSRAVSGTVAFAVSFAFITFIHVVIGEQAPKSLAIRRTDWAALAVARPLRAFYLVSFPVMWLVNVTSNGVLRLLRIPPITHLELAHSEEELRMILGASLEKGAFTLNRLLMMENVLDFGTLKVRDVMTPSERVVMLDPDKPWPENVEVIRRSLHSRYPLEVRGVPSRDRIVHIKDILTVLVSGKTPDLRASSRPLRSVRPDIPLEELLQHFHRTHSHIACVEDEAGHFLGIATIEDVVEELIGTVRDEFESVKELNLSDIVSPEAVALDLEPMTKDRAIRTLTERLAKSFPTLDVAAVVAAINRREALASTGLGDGIAIPHGRVYGLPRPMAAIGQSQAGIPFDSLDGRPTNLIFLVLTPVHDEGAHVHILGKISALLSSDYLRERLLQARRAEEVLDVLRVADRSLPA